MAKSRPEPKSSGRDTLHRLEVNPNRVRYVNKLNQVVRVQVIADGKPKCVNIASRGTLTLEGKESSDLAAKVKAGVLAKR